MQPEMRAGFQHFKVKTYFLKIIVSLIKEIGVKKVEQKWNLMPSETVIDRKIQLIPDCCSQPVQLSDDPLKVCFPSDVGKQWKLKCMQTSCAAQSVSQKIQYLPHYPLVFTLSRCSPAPQQAETLSWCLTSWLQTAESAWRYDIIT